jgi:hypothetical protein
VIDEVRNSRFTITSPPAAVSCEPSTNCQLLTANC